MFGLIVWAFFCALLGSAANAAPDSKFVNVAGLKSFIDAQGVSVFGSLVNSHVGPITIDGDACFVLTGGDNGTMALSVGGFHPQYKERPAGIKPMKRLRAELSDVSGVHLSQLGPSLNGGGVPLGMKTWAL